MRSQHFQQVSLSPKQVIFLLIAATVIGAVIFLFGVVIGRGVPLVQALTGGAGIGMADPDAAIGDERPAIVSTPRRSPSAVATDGVRLSYYDRLAGGRGRELDARLGGAGAASAGPRSAPAAGPADGAETPDRSGAPPGEYPGGYAVQVTALRERAAAERMADRLAGKGYPAFVAGSVGGAPVHMFRVRVGTYASREEAERVRQRLEQEEALAPWITR